MENTNIYLLTFLDLEQALALAPISQGLLRFLYIIKPLMRSIRPANVNSMVEFCPNHFNCGKINIVEASIVPRPIATNRLGMAQHIKVESEVKSPTYSTIEKYLEKYFIK